jgi:hypothetical protein
MSPLIAWAVNELKTIHHFKLETENSEEAEKQIQDVDFDLELSKPVNVPLVFKQNGPDRNSIAKLLKQTKNVKVSIIIHDISKGGCRWSVMVESDDAVACYNNPSTNIIPFL